MERKIIFLSLALLSSTVMMAKEVPGENFEDYHRSSMTMVTVVHPADSFSNEIQEACLAMPFPEKYNEHNIGLTFLEGTPHADRKADLTADLDAFIAREQVAKKLVARWFNFDGNKFDADLIRERGQYDASISDALMAMQTVRGKSELEDAGEELISKTFFLVNDISYVDHEERAKVVAEGSRAVGEATEAVTDVIGGVMSIIPGLGGIGSLVQSAGSMVKATGDLVGGITDLLDISGFVVRINTYLYQLEWNDSVASVFYGQYCTDGSEPDKIAAFMADTTTFKMKLVGKHEQFTDKGTLYSSKTQEEQMLVTCTRTLDKNIANLQKKYPDFQVKVPIYQVVTNEKGKVKGYMAHVGLKEGITEKTKFSVLEKSLDENGRTKYKKIGELKPVKGAICDNRYMAAEELAEQQRNAGEDEFVLEGTLLKGKGKNIMAGMLIMEGDYNKMYKK